MIDTHCHIDDPQYAEDFDAFILSQQQGGVERILVPGVNRESLQTVLAVCQRYPHYLYPALGLHPEDVRADWQQELAAIREVVFATPLVAIGEIGLDYHFDTTYRAEQQAVLREQMRWAEQLDLPVIIHCRDAVEDTLRILQEFPAVKGVFHCFSSSREVAQQVLKMGYLLGIGGVLTFKNCHLADTLRSVPLPKLVLETDAPYMAPVPNRGKRNESRWMSYVRDRLADIYQVTPDDVDYATTSAAMALFWPK